MVTRISKVGIRYEVEARVTRKVAPQASLIELLGRPAVADEVSISNAPLPDLHIFQV